MAIKLIALDLDGTLLSSDKTISHKNKTALQLARQAGVQVVLTTGRPLPAIEHLLQELDLVGEGNYSITFNGGLVQENTGNILAKTPLTLDDVLAIRQLANELALPLDLVSGGDVYVLDAAVESLYPACNPMLHFVSATDQDLTADKVFNKGVTACSSDLIAEKLPLIPAHYHERFEIFKSRDILLEWSPKGVHKAAGLEQLIAHLGIERSEVMACGDEENDMSMVEWAGLGVAMANASEPLKAVANSILPVTNDEDAIAYAIEQYILKGESNGVV